MRVLVCAILKVRARSGFLNPMFIPYRRTPINLEFTTFLMVRKVH